MSDVANVAEEQLENNRVPSHLSRYCWRPGQSGNPGGRPKGTVSLRVELARILRRHPEKAQAVVCALLKKAVAGDVRAIALCGEWLDGSDHPLVSIGVSNTVQAAAGGLNLTRDQIDRILLQRFKVRLLANPDFLTPQERRVLFHRLAEADHAGASEPSERV